MLLAGKRVFVSGGTGFIGSAIVKACVANGAEVLFSYNSGKEFAEELTRELPGTTAVHMNILKKESIKSAVSEVMEGGAVDVLINNAGVAQVMPFSLIEEEDYDFVMDVNVKGTFFVTKAVLRSMIKQKKGSIVNISSIAGHRLLEVPVHYATSKAALTGLTFGLASELRKFNIRVNSVCPGMIKDGVSKGIPEQQKQDFIDHCAVGREGTAEEVAETVCFIASDKAAYINAQDIFIDGGI